MKRIDLSANDVGGRLALFIIRPNCSPFPPSFRFNGSPGLCGFKVLLRTEFICHTERAFMQEQDHILGCTCFPALISSSNNESSPRLPLLSRNVLFTYLRSVGFWASGSPHLSGQFQDRTGKPDPTSQGRGRARIQSLSRTPTQASPTDDIQRP